MKPRGLHHLVCGFVSEKERETFPDLELSEDFIWRIAQTLIVGWRVFQIREDGIVIFRPLDENDDEFMILTFTEAELRGLDDDDVANL